MSEKFLALGDYLDSDSQQFGEDDKPIFRISDVRMQVDKDIFAICEYCTPRQDVNHKTYLRFLFRDCNGQRMPGRMYSQNQGFDNMANVMHGLLGNVVKMKFSLEYFNTFYLKVKEIYVVDKKASDRLKNEFFQKDIPNFVGEFDFFKRAFYPALTGNVELLYNSFNTEFILTNGYYEDVMNGLRGSSIRVCNLFASNVMNSYSQQYGTILNTAFLFIEAILIAGQIDTIQSVEKFKQLMNLAETVMDPNVRLILNIVESYIYYSLNFVKPMYDSSTLYIDSVRNHTLNLLRQSNMIDNNPDVFEYNGKFFEKRINF